MKFFKCTKVFKFFPDVDIMSHSDHNYEQNRTEQKVYYDLSIKAHRQTTKYIIQILYTCIKKHFISMNTVHNESEIKYTGNKKIYITVNGVVHC